MKSKASGRLSQAKVHRAGDGQSIDVRRYGDGPVADEFEPLVDMYRRLDPEFRRSGVPPVGDAAIRTWLGHILTGYSFVAWDGTTAVGHVVLVPDGSGAHELAVFVHQAYHDRGIGSRLVGAILALGTEEGIADVTLQTDSDNRPMLELALRNGFGVIERGAGQLVLSARLSENDTPPGRSTT